MLPQFDNDAIKTVMVTDRKLCDITAGGDIPDREKQTLVESVLSRQLDDEPTLMRHGYRLKDMAELFDAKPAEIRVLFGNKLDLIRSAELRVECWR